MRKLKIEKKSFIHPISIGKDDAKQRYGIGESSLNKIARKIGAEIRVGRRKLYLTSKMDAYFENLPK